MNVVGFQADDLDDFDRPGVRTASALRDQMGIDRVVFTPTLYSTRRTGTSAPTAPATPR